MKSYARYTKQCLRTALLLACGLITWLFPSCASLIDEDLSDCLFGTGIKFEYLIYDDNGGSADAFAKSVNSVTLYVFDNEGRYVCSQMAAGETLRDPKWRMSLDLDPGQYHVIAWAGLEGGSFIGPVEYDQKEGAQVRLDCQNLFSDKELQPLWHGAADITVKKEYTEHTVSLIKDTRRIRIVLQHANGDPVSAKDFDFQITDDNSHLGHDNLPIPEGIITYSPYAKGEDAVGGNNDGTGSTTVAFAELSTSRLVAGNKPRLKITRTEDNGTVMDIPLLDYLLLRRAEASNITDQQFLDRTDAYTLIFFLDNDLSWLKTQIIINGWVIRLNSGNIGG